MDRIIIEGIKAFRSGISKSMCPHLYYAEWVRWTTGWELAEAVSRGVKPEFVERYLAKNRIVFVARVEGRYMYDTTDRESHESIVKELG